MPIASEQDPNQAPSVPPYRLLYDGRCSLCRREVDRLIQLSGLRVRKESYQSAWPGSPPADEIRLVAPNGTIYEGSEAVARTLAQRGSLRWIAWIYSLPIARRIFRSICDWSSRSRYRVTVGPRPEGTCATHERQFLMTEAGHVDPPALPIPTYRRSTKVFLVMLGLIYASVFASLFVQVPTLIGSGGLIPAGETLTTVAARVEPGGEGSAATYLGFPTLFWVDSSDVVLRGGCVLGIVLAVCVVLGFFRGPALLGLGLLHISYVVVGRTFFSFQWDNLLIETTLCALLLPNYSIPLLSRSRGASARLRLPSAVAIFLVQWLLFRLYFESGVAKVLYAGGGWRDLSAMSHYYNTAPLPTWVGWFAHNLPEWWHRCETLLTLWIELIVPVFIFAGRRPRQIAFCVFQAFQIAIILTANYGIFNYVSLALGFFLLEDRDYDPIFRMLRRLRRSSGEGRTYPIHAPNLLVTTGRAVLLTVIAIGIVAASLLEFSLLAIHDRDYRTQVAAWRSDWLYGNFRLVNSYHLFASMTTERVVPEIEGQGEDGQWHTYPYRWAPSEATEPPRFAAPHHPRLDFQMWFVTLSRNGHRRPFFSRLLDRLCEDPEFADRAFRSDPFADTLPQKLRVVGRRYDMTTPEERAASGAWWNRTGERILVPEFSCTESGSGG